MDNREIEIEREKFFQAEIKKLHRRTSGLVTSHRFLNAEEADEQGIEHDFELDF